MSSHFNGSRWILTLVSFIAVIISILTIASQQGPYSPSLRMPQSLRGLCYRDRVSHLIFIRTGKTPL